MRLLNTVCCQTLLSEFCFHTCPKLPWLFLVLQTVLLFPGRLLQVDHLFGNFPWNCTSLCKTCFCTLNCVFQFKKLFFFKYFTLKCAEIPALFIPASVRKKSIYCGLAMLGRANRLVTCFQRMLHCCWCSLMWRRMIFDVLCHLLLVRPSLYEVVGLWWFSQRMYETWTLSGENSRP